MKNAHKQKRACRAFFFGLDCCRIFVVEYKTKKELKRLCRGFAGVAAAPDITTAFRWIATQFTCKGHT